MEEKALPSALKTGWLVLAGCRWVALGIAFLALLSGYDLSAPRGTIWLLLALSALYTLALTAGRDILPQIYARHYAPIGLDVLICAGLLFFSGPWDSPFYLYSLSPVLLASFLTGGRVGAITGILSLAAYIGANWLRGYSFGGLLQEAAVDQLTGMAAYLMVAIFFSYPSSFLRQLQERNEELSQAKESLAKANKSLESVNRQLVAVQTINAVLQSYLDLPMVMESILDSIKYGLDFDRVVVGLIDESSDRIFEWRIIGEPQSAAEQDWAVFELPILPDSAMSRMFAADLPIVVDAAAPGEIDKQLIDFLDAGASPIALMPLKVGSRRIGLIVVDNSASGRPIAPEDVTWLAVLATHAAIAINNAQLYSKAQELAAVTERNRIAMEIHDGLAQTLSGARLILNSCNRILPSAPDEVQVKLAYLEKMLARSYEEMRYAIYNLRLPFLSVDSLTAFFRQYIHEFSEFSGIKAKLAIGGSEDMAVLGEDAKLCLSRVLQECLNNAHKHSGATSLTVFFTFQPRRVILKIVDNGRGFRLEAALEEAKHGKTFGIVATENRVRQLGGQFRVDSSPDLGTSIKVTMPYMNSAEVDFDKSARR